MSSLGSVHVHAHRHPENAPDDNGQANRHHFDHFASEYDQVPGVLELTRKGALEILKVFPFSEGGTVAMEFGCGTGLVSKELVPHVKSILGVDISQGMVDQFNKRAQDEGISSEKMHAVRCELEGKEGELDGIKFDVIFCTYAYHHFESIDKVTRILADFLKPGGCLIVIDFEKTEHDLTEGEVRRKDVAHLKGIEKSDILDTLEHSGLELVTYEQAFKAELRDIPREGNHSIRILCPWQILSAAFLQHLPPYSVRVKYSLCRKRVAKSVEFEI